MRMKPGSLTIVFLISLLSGTNSLNAQWVNDGAPVCATPQSQSYTELIQDGAGGTIVTWQDNRSGDYDIYAQRVSAYGRLIWLSDGAAICTATNLQQHPKITPDGAGGAIIAWKDNRRGIVATVDIYAQRIDAAGNVLWATDGIAIYSDTLTVDELQIISDGAGGAIIAWSDNRSGNYHIYAQRINPNGVIQWAAGGIPICTYPGDQWNPQLISDHTGGAIIVWREDRSGIDYIYAQRIDENGLVQWTTNGEAVNIAIIEKDYLKITPDGNGGAVIAWAEYYNGDWGIYAQRVDRFGNTIWGNIYERVPICTAAGSQSDLQIIPDSYGGYMLTWQDTRSGGYDIYAQKIDASGSAQWTVDGVAICTATNSQRWPQITADGAGEAIVTWHDERNGNHDIYAQKINTGGTTQWAANGVPICTATGDQLNSQLITCEMGGAIITWEDYRSGTSKIYSQMIGRQSYWGNSAAEISSIEDVQGDQGGAINLSWYASRLDPGEHLISHYTLWRAIQPTEAKQIINRGASLLSDVADLTPETTGPVIRMEQRGGKTYFWDLVGTQNAYYLNAYLLMLPTLFDSSIVCTEHHYFQVVAHAYVPGDFWISLPDSGYSVDNLAPAQPQDFSGIQNLAPQGLHLSWLPNSEPDLSHYAIYRGDNEGFVLNESSLIGATTDTMLIDTEWTPIYQYFYKLAAVDIHGNIGPDALLRPEDIQVGTLLQSFAASFVDSWIEISWTLLEAGVDMKFFILKAEGLAGTFKELFDPEIKKESLSFTFKDKSLKPGEIYVYRVEVQDEEGRSLLFETNRITTPAISLALYQNHPNPFNPPTTIRYYLPEGGWVNLEVYDITGRRIACLVNMKQQEGSQTVEWNGSDKYGDPVASGIYSYVLRVGKDKISRKMVLLR